MVRFFHGLCWLPLAALVSSPGAGWAKGEFGETIEPILETYCYDCHGDGSAKGDFSLDEYGDLSAHLSDHDLWLKVWTNLRSQLMPPAKKDQPEAEEREVVLRWIEREVFRLDPENPDPGRVTVRRLNREEYRNTVRDLFGVDYEVQENFPPDDTGYGFDTIGDVLSLSPLLLEKYLAAAEDIMAEALPENAARVPEQVLTGKDFRQPDKPGETGRLMEFERPHTVRAERSVRHAGRYEIEMQYRVTGAMDATDNTATLVLLLDGEEIARERVGWDYRKKIRMGGQRELKKGKRRLEVRIEPGQKAAEGEDPLRIAVEQVRLRGPLEHGMWMYPESYQRVLFRGPGPEGRKKRAEYAREIMTRMVRRVFRRSAEEGTVERLVALAMAKDAEKGATFEDGIRHAMVALLSSPRFLFRAEVQAEPDNRGKVVPLDEFALASRLSYFLWSSCPDDELLRLAEEGQLRARLGAQVDRMLEDPKSARFVRNFTGQWLHARDMVGVNINARVILGLRRTSEANRLFNLQTRLDMKRETEMFFSHILREGRPALELLTADYTFLNNRLAKYYGLPEVEGAEFRRVELGENRQRGGLLSQGTFLVVTSNPTRTSPVKRGMFVLENLLGTPPPPAPPEVPELEEAGKKEDRELTMRELMERHRSEPVCKSCHARMDPIGLALENYNAVGMWRDREGGEPIDTAGRLVTGEQFSGVEELKELLATSRRQDFHRCLAEKLLTYAIGRGVEYYDGPTIDAIVARAEGAGGSLRDFVDGVIASTPFQQRRGDG